MKKTHKTSFAKRTFSLLLCAAMLAGLFVGVQVSTSLVAQAGLAKVPVGDFPAVNFSVPDTIWLAPNASNSMNSMRYYGNVGIDGVREANASDTGKVYFSMAGATSITLKVSGASFGNTSGFGPSSNSLAASFSGGTLGSSLSAGTGTRITWTLEFTYEGAVYTCRGYSYVQAPTLNVVGAAASTNTYYGLSPTYYHSDGLFLMGVHSVSGSVSTGNSKYTPNAQGTYGPNDTLRAQLISGNADGSAWPNERYLTSGGGIGYARIDSHSGDNGDLHLNVGGTTGVFTVDVSRFDNLNQVPGLIGAHVLTDADETHDGFRDNSRIEFPSGTKIAGLSGGGGRGFYWRTTNPASGSGSLHLGLSASNTSTETKGFWSYLEIGRNVFLGNYGNLEHYLSFNLTIIKSNKAALRKAVRDAISVPIEFYGSNLAALDSKLQSAVDQLGSVTTTETTMAQELNAAVNGYKDPGVVPIKSAPDINFVVPETIYLALTTSGAMSTFSSYANGGAVTRSTGASGTGTVSFSMQGATNIKIENGGTGPSANCAAFNATGLSATAANNSYSSNFAGSLAAGIDARATATICWKATWTFEGRNYTSYAYTVVQAPSRIMVGAATRKVDGDEFLQGVVALMGGWSRTGGNRGVHQNLNDDLINNSHRGSNQGVEGVYLTGGDGGGFGYANSSSSGTLTANGGTAYLQVDTSRYGNLNQVPGLLAAYFITDDEHTEDGFFGNSGLYFGPNGGTLSWLTAFGPTGNGQGSNKENIYGRTSSLPLALNESGTTTGRLRVYAELDGQLKTENNCWITITGASKAAQRAAVQSAMNAPFNSADHTAATLNDLQAKLKAVAENLGTGNAAPDAAATNNLSNAVAAMKPNGTATSYHYSTNGNVPILEGTTTETLPYKYGEMVIGSANTYEGYTFKYSCYH